MTSRVSHALPLLSLAIACALLASIICAGAAGEGDLKSSLKEAGEAMKKLGKKVGEGGKDAGEEIADAAKKVWYKGKRVSARLLHDVQRSTREFWEKSVATKDRTIEKLRAENDKLKRRLAEDE